MAKVSKESASQIGDTGAVESREEEVDGYTISFLSCREDVDATPLLKGQPDDSCQCPHWGYVLKGKLTYRFADRDEVFGPGDAFYLPPGHVPLAEKGCEFVQFSPTAELRIMHEAMRKNAEALKAAG